MAEIKNSTGINLESLTAEQRADLLKKLTESAKPEAPLSSEIKTSPKPAGVDSELDVSNSVKTFETQKFQNLDANVVPSAVESTPGEMLSDAELNKMVESGIFVNSAGNPTEELNRLLEQMQK